MLPKACRHAPDQRNDSRLSKFGPGDKLNVRPGYVNSLPVKSSVQLIEVFQKLAQGMSGGPILDDDGKVAAVIHKGGSEEARDFGVHIQVLMDWLKELAGSRAKAVTTTP